MSLHDTICLHVNEQSRYKQAAVLLEGAGVRTSRL